MLKKINIVNDLSNGNFILSTFLDFLSIEHTILYVFCNIDNSKPPKSSNYTTLSVDMDEINIEAIQQHLFRVDLIVFDYGDRAFNLAKEKVLDLIQESIKIGIKLDKNCIINVPMKLDKLNINDLDFGLFTFSRKYSPNQGIYDSLIIKDENNGNSFSLADYKKTHIRNSQIGNIIGDDKD